MPTTYLSSSGIDQKFTSGPYSGSLVKKGFSNLAGNLVGPDINFFQNFKSGSEEDINTVNEIINCGKYYYRITEDPILCPPGGCAIPILTSAALSSSCTSVYDFKYNVTYNSASAGALRTKIEYSTNSTFSSNTASTDWIDNSSPFTTPINVNNLSNLPLNNTTPVYFRAFNECSPILTSSYSNTLTAICTTPAPAYESFDVFISNQSTRPIYVKRSDASVATLVQSGFTPTYPFSTSKIDFQISIIGAATATPPTRINTGETNAPQYSITASATSNYSSLISTAILPQIDSRVSNDGNYTITIIPPTQQTSTSKTTTLYDLHQLVTSNNLTLTPSLKTVFASIGSSTATNEVIVNIDRTKWNKGGRIDITIKPLTTQYYLYNPPATNTCVLSGTIITLADGSTTPIDNLRVGNRVLSPSILTLPSNNDFDLFNWAINELILTEGTAVVRGNERLQVNEVYSINSGLLVTTSTHQHLFKHNGVWGIKNTSYLMVGDYFYDKNGNEILIESIEIFPGEFTVFNLDVEENDLYIANGILTHNKLAPQNQ